MASSEPARPSALRRVAFAPALAGWRAAARRLLEDGVAPAAVLWEPADDEQPALDGLGDAGGDGDGDAPPSPRFRVPRRFFELAEGAACHADGERWALLYRVLWRVTHDEPHLLEVAVDPDVHRLLRMEK